MLIYIHLTRAEAEHIYPDHNFIDCCSEVESIMLKVQKAVQIRLEQEDKERERKAK